MTPTTTAVFDAIANLDALTDKMEDTQWIILDGPVRTALYITRILRVGMMVRVRKGWIGGCLVNCDDEYGPTHVIIALRNNITNTAFEIDAEEIGGEETITIKL